MGVVRQNPARAVRLLREPPGRVRYLEPDETNRLLDACPHHLRPVVVTALNTGLRKSEIFSLKWRQVDMKARRLTVENTKNHEPRTIPINNTLYEELKRLPRYLKSEYVFCNRYGQPYVDIKRSFGSVLKKAGIQNFRFHDLRHTFASYLVMSGCDIRTVQQLMGHKDIKMTMKYSHLSKDHLTNSVNRLDTIWTPEAHSAKAPII